MPLGNFYERRSAEGMEFEVVLLNEDELATCKEQLRARKVTVRDEATMGHFTIHLDDPMQWSDVGAVVFGEVFPHSPDRHHV